MRPFVAEIRRLSIIAVRAGDLVRALDALHEVLAGAEEERCAVVEFQNIVRCS